MASSSRLFSFSSGGWVLLLAGVICLLLIGWAVAPAIILGGTRPPGDGRNIESYDFHLGVLNVPRDLIAPATPHRDFIPAIFEPTFSDPVGAQKRNDPKYGKYLVSSDRVIGVSINGESRAYPLQVMTVHAIVNDTLGDPPLPIAVTYDWLCDSIAVYDRRFHRGENHCVVGEFAVSGLVYNSNLLMYARNEIETSSAVAPHGNALPTPGLPSGAASGGESLWDQLTGSAISGNAAKAQQRLGAIPYEFAAWSDWLQRHPETTVINRDLNLIQRYKKSNPAQYFRSDKLLFPVQPLPDADALPWKTPVVVVQTDEARRVYPLPHLIEQARRSGTNDPPMWSDTLGSTTITFLFDSSLQTVRVEADPPQTPLRVTHAFWFAWHALHPDDELADVPH